MSKQEGKFPVTKRNRQNEAALTCGGEGKETHGLKLITNDYIQ